ncbi:hypothetical protein WA538_004484, partial [Blastocystis sp. DL]
MLARSLSHLPALSTLGTAASKAAMCRMNRVRFFSEEQNDNVIEIKSIDEFEPYKKADRASISFFTSKKDNSCRMIDPLFSHFSTMATNITFLKMELAENEALAKMEKVNVVPTFILYKKGELLSRFSGASGLDLMSLIEVAND